MRTRFILSLLALAALAGVAAACRGVPAPMPTLTQRAASTPVSTTASTTEPAIVNGASCPQVFEATQLVTREVDLSAGQVLTLTLGSTPSIPCGWQDPDVSEPGVLHQTNHERIWPAEGVTPMPGAPGTEFWVFEPVTRGRAEVSVVCTCLDEEGAEQVVDGRLVVQATVK